MVTNADGICCAESAYLCDLSGSALWNSHFDLRLPSVPSANRSPTMDAFDEMFTERLLLRRLRSNEEGSQDLEWLHAVASDGSARQFRYMPVLRTGEVMLVD